MCLAIPAQLIEYLDEERQFARVELGGVRRRVNTMLLTGPDAAEVGDYVLVHVGFAMSRISEAEAQKTLSMLEQMGSAFTDEMAQLSESEALTVEEQMNRTSGPKRGDAT
jgi:hydrogenase expression/formation protein HypC